MHVICISACTFRLLADVDDTRAAFESRAGVVLCRRDPRVDDYVRIIGHEESEGVADGFYDRRSMLRCGGLPWDFDAGCTITVVAFHNPNWARRMRHFPMHSNVFMLVKWHEAAGVGERSDRMLLARRFNPCLPSERSASPITGPHAKV